MDEYEREAEGGLRSEPASMSDDDVIAAWPWQKPEKQASFVGKLWRTSPVFSPVNIRENVAAADARAVGQGLWPRQ